VQTAALEPPADAAQQSARSSETTVLPPAAPTEARKRYWVEYGVFAGRRYAEGLQTKLQAKGLAAVITSTHTPGGRHLFRVRSEAMTKSEATAAARRAKALLRVSTLVHREHPTEALPPGRYEVKYEVQFGAFRTTAPAARVARELAQAGIKTVVRAVPGTISKTLFVIRSYPVRDRLDATAVAARGSRVTALDTLVVRRGTPSEAALHHQVQRRPHRVALSRPPPGPPR
jgi:cell division protein FtsN